MVLKNSIIFIVNVSLKWVWAYESFLKTWPKFIQHSHVERIHSVDINIGNEAIFQLNEAPCGQKCWSLYIIEYFVIILSCCTQGMFVCYRWRFYVFVMSVWNQPNLILHYAISPHSFILHFVWQPNYTIN